MINGKLQEFIDEVRRQVQNINISHPLFYTSQKWGRIDLEKLSVLRLLTKDNIIYDWSETNYFTFWRTSGCGRCLWNEVSLVCPNPPRENSYTIKEIPITFSVFGSKEKSVRDTILHLQRF